MHTVSVGLCDSSGLKDTPALWKRLKCNPRGPKLIASSNPNTIGIFHSSNLQKWIFCEISTVSSQQ